jgi:agmatine/peptidylarginine deiminase
MIRNICLSTILTITIAISFAQTDRRMVAEWEPAYGTLIRWPLGIPSDLVVALAEDDSLYVLVEHMGEMSQAMTSFNSWGVNTDHCRFIFTETYSHWTRDWGPHYIFDEEGQACIVDPMFDGYPWVPGCNDRGNQPKYYNHRGYEEDDAVNQALAEEFGLPLVELPVYLTGGNIMTDGHHMAVSTQQMLDESAPFCDEDCFMQVTADSMGLFDYFISLNPEIYGIQHIDCYAKFLDEEKVLVKELDTWHPEYQCVEDLADFLGNIENGYGERYQVVRIYCAPYNGDEVAAYTNSLILNDKVYVPLFNIEEDQQAMDTYRDAMPGYEVIGFYHDTWYYYDALHCRTMAIFDPEMLVVRHKRVKRAAADHQVEIIATFDDRSETGLNPDELKVFWREEGGFSWNHVLMAPAYGADTFAAFIPAFPDGTVIDYFVSASDYSGRTETMPRPAPGGFYQFYFTNLITGTGDFTQSNIEIKIFPTIFRDKTNILIEGAEAGDIRIEIFNSTGEIIKTFNHNHNKNMVWDGTNQSGTLCAPGIYFIHVMADRKAVLKKVILVR